MPYDASLDESLFAKTHETENNKITVSVYSYNKGQKKLQITRENRTADGKFRFTKLGRLVKEEVQAILPLVQEATQLLD
jgi:hypothetical protein